MEISRKIDNIIRDEYWAKGFEPRIIVMHPVTWDNLVKELCIKNLTTYPYIPDFKLAYKGYKVARSLDIAEGEIGI